MRVVMRYYEGDGCTYSCTNTIPIEYESPEAALLDFEKAIQSVKAYEFFKFAGEEWIAAPFYDGMDYSAPDFLTVDEWFGVKQ